MGQWDLYLYEIYMGGPCSIPDGPKFVCEVSCMGFIWDYYGIYMGFIWGFILWDLYEIFMGALSSTFDGQQLILAEKKFSP